MYEWNDLAGARQYATESVRLCKMGEFVSYMLAGYAVLANVHRARGDVDDALEVVQNAARLAEQHDYPYMAAILAEQRIRLWLAEGNLVPASR